MEIEYSAQAVSWAAQLVRAYTDSVDGNLTEAVAILNELEGDETQLRNFVASLAGLAGHAVMVIAAQLEADLPEDVEGQRLERLSDRRTSVLLECTRALREFRPAHVGLSSAARFEGLRLRGDRRSGRDRRLGSDRRQGFPGSPSERINLQLYGERRRGSSTRRSGSERRGA